MELKLSVSGKNGKAYSIKLEESKAQNFVGKRLGDEISGGLIGLDGYKLKITGGSDADGFPMKAAVKGTKRVKSFMKEGVGMREKREGIKKRKFVRGNMVSEQITQLNLKIVEEGEKPVSELLGEEKEEDEGTED